MEASAEPTISAPSASTGEFIVTLSFSWPESGSSKDAYTLEESTTSSSDGFVEIATSPEGAWHQTFSFPMYRTNGTYFYRARAWLNDAPSPYSSVVTVVVSSNEFARTFYASNTNLLVFNSTNDAMINTVDTTSDLSVGTNYDYGAAGQYQFIRTASLLKFNMQSTIALKTILEAKLVLYPRSIPSDTVGVFQLAAIGSYFNSSTTTWNTWSRQVYIYTSNSVFFAAPRTTSMPLQLDVTAIVRNWANGSWFAIGLELWEPKPQLPGIDSYQAVTFESLGSYTNPSHRPQLFVRYK